MKILVTGTAGFIGFFAAKRLLEANITAGGEILALIRQEIIKRNLIVDFGNSVGG